MFKVSLFCFMKWFSIWLNLSVAVNIQYIWCSSTQIWGQGLMDVWALSKIMYALFFNRHHANFRVHDKIRPHQCGQCELAFFKQSDLARHKARVHDGIRSFVCSKCDLSFALNQNLIRHFESVHEGKKKWECSLCLLRFTTKQSRNDHRVKVHEGKTDFTCPICNVGFNTGQSQFKSILITFKGILFSYRRSQGKLERCAL